MRLLYITEGFPYPLTSGFLRHYHLIRGLSRNHEIDLVSIVGRDFRTADVEGMQPYVSRVETVRAVGRSRSSVIKAAGRIKDLALRSGSDHAGQALARVAGRMLAETPYDVVVLSGRRTDGVLESLGGTPLVVDLCDATATRLAGSLPYASPLRRVMIRLEHRRVRNVERCLVEAGRYLLFASQRDRDLLLGGAHPAKASVVPNGVDLEFWHRQSPRLGDEVVFSGAMNYRPNEDAALYLIREIMPRVWESEPTTRVRIVGRDPTIALRRAGSDPRVTVTGFVEDVRPHLEAGAVFVAPLRFGAGIQNKLLEAMAMEIPVVTSPVAAAGVQTDDGQPAPVTIAHDAGGFAAEALAVLHATREDPTPRAEARHFVAQRFAWDRAVQTLERILTNAVEGSP